MGTRGVIGMYKKGKGKITYNHFDSYPDGVGKDILKETRDTTIEKMNKAFDSIKLIKDETKKPTEEEIKEYRKYSDTSVGESINNKKINTYYQLLRHLQGTLKPYFDGECKIMTDSEDFLKDSLFCEWGYIVNLDTNMFEVWTNSHVIKEYPLDKLPSEEEFLKDMKKIEDEQE